MWVSRPLIECPSNKEDLFENLARRTVSTIT
jgi:hypothetical protein